MSATGRGAERQPADFYATPPWCVQRLLEAVTLPGGWWLEPGAGAGNIIRAVGKSRLDVRWDAVEQDGRHADNLYALGANVHTRDFLTWTPTMSVYDVAIGNPPYQLAQPFIAKALTCAKTVAFLLRLNFLASQKRSEFMRENPPDVYVLPNRPSFVNGRTDATEYAWFVWTRGKRGGVIRVLADTPKSERAA